MTLDFSLYQLVLAQLPEKPDLALVQKRHPVPESWPVVLKDVVTYRNQLQHFLVTDGSHDAVCYTAVPEIQDRVIAMEVGTLLHLIGAETRFNDATKCYVIELQGICTLKEYDERLRAQEQAKASRMAWLKQQGYLEEAGYESAAAPQNQGTGKKKQKK